MSSIYYSPSLPAKITDFRVKLGAMLDQRCARPVTQGNVIAFPGNCNRFGNIYADYYLQACQALLGPIAEFFYKGHDTYFSIHDLDTYLHSVFQVVIDKEPLLNLDDQQCFALQVGQLQLAGFEYVSRLYPEILAAYGDQLVEYHHFQLYETEIRNTISKAVSVISSKAFIASER